MKQHYIALAWYLRKKRFHFGSRVYTRLVVIYLLYGFPASVSNDPYDLGSRDTNMSVTHS